MPHFPTKPTTSTRLNSCWLPVVSLEETILLPGLTVPIHELSRKTRSLFRKASRQRKEVVIAPQNSAGCFSDIGCRCQMTGWSGANTQNPLIIVRGLKRVRIETINQESQTAHIENVLDHYPEKSGFDREERRSELLQVFLSRFPKQTTNQFTQPLLERDLPFGTLCDVLAFSCKLSTVEYIVLLSELDVDQRCDFVLEMLLDANRNLSEIEFPPPFSWN